MKKLTIGATSFIAGALLMTGISGYAAPALEKVSAYVNNTVTLKLNGEKVETSQPILTYNDRTYVYLKDVGELVGADVGWNNDERSVEIVSDPVDDESEKTINEATVKWIRGRDLNKYFLDVAHTPEKFTSGILYGDVYVINDKKEYPVDLDSYYYDDRLGTFYTVDFMLSIYEEKIINSLPTYSIEKNEDRSKTKITEISQT
ncbi:stalk domain-containing protein [Paenibacillus sp. HB172176]|uniref:stalk domain-containing protein n=1 Tax=Paenibacillus sp. HB172176 TaxID=2493690 RepID=UPI001439A1E9|nr:stalk domain-containing protein [Paenibacillus sp. HB172176]